MRLTTKLFATLLSIGIFFSSCGQEEKFVDARKIEIWNYDAIPVEIFVNGEKAAEFSDFLGEIHLLSGEYEIMARNGRKEINKINLSLDKKTENKDEYYKNVFVLGKKRNYVLIDVAGLYENGKRLKVEEKYLGVNKVELKKNTYRMYWPGDVLPKAIYVSEKGDAGIFQLIELPDGFKNKNDQEIVDYCSSIIK